jgi:hypothetical protein
MTFNIGDTVKIKANLDQSLWDKVHLGTFIRRLEGATGKIVREASDYGGSFRVDGQEFVDGVESKIPFSWYLTSEMLEKSEATVIPDTLEEYKSYLHEKVNEYAVKHDLCDDMTDEFLKDLGLPVGLNRNYTINISDISPDVFRSLMKELDEVAPDAWSVIYGDVVE